MSRTPDTADVVICGAGIAGVATAYHLSVERGITDVAIVDPLAPLSLTSDKSMECYRNWYPGPGDAMVRLMNRSIDLIERLERDNAYRFNMNRRGYLFATADPAQANRLLEEAREEERLGTGELRVHRSAASESVYAPAPGRGFEGEPSGSDLLLDPDLIQTHFPYLSQHTIGLLHTRRCGWFSAHEYASFLLEQARAHGVQLVNARVESVTCAGGQVNGVRVSDGGSARTIGTRCFVSAAGPMQTEIGAMLDVDLPIACELHVKAAFHDPGQVIPRDAPQIIWMDPVHLRWTEEERGLLSEAPETVRMLDEFPPGVHGRPEGGGDVVLLQWSNDNTAVEPTYPLDIDPYYPEMLLRGMAVAVPGLEPYLGRAAKPFMDGGYYAKTPENRPLAGPLAVDGAYIIGALSGFGMQSASALGELVSLHVANETLPEYADAFRLSRYQDPDYVRALEQFDASSGQI